MEQFEFKVDGEYLSDKTSLPKSLKVFIYNDPVEIWAASWPEELEDGVSYVGIDKDGNEVDYTDEDGINGIREQGCFGFTVWNKELHLYFDPVKCSVFDFILLLGHEIGHLQRPYKRNFMAEEMKAEHYSDFVGYFQKLFDSLKNNTLS